MGGEVLDLPEIRLYHAGRALGFAQSFAETMGERFPKRDRECLEDVVEGYITLVHENDSLREEVIRLRREIDRMKSDG